MKAVITHVAVYTENLEKMREFYETYFNAESNQLYKNDEGFSSYFLSFGNSVRFELMSHEKLEQREVLEKVNGISHIAFSVGTRKNVLQLTERIARDGYIVYSTPRDTGDGYFESCVSDPDGNRIEITL